MVSYDFGGVASTRPEAARDLVEPDLQQGLGHRAADRAGEHPELLDHPGPALRRRLVGHLTVPPPEGRRAERGSDTDGERRHPQTEHRDAGHGPGDSHRGGRGDELGGRHLLQAAAAHPGLEAPVQQGGHRGAVVAGGAAAGRPQRGEEQVGAHRRHRREALTRPSAASGVGPGRLARVEPRRSRRSTPPARGAPLARIGRRPDHTRGAAGWSWVKTSVVVNCTASGPAVRSSTARMADTGLGWAALGVHHQVDGLADQGVERRHRQVVGRVGETGATKRSRVRAWRAEPAWIVV